MLVTFLSALGISFALQFFFFVFAALFRTDKLTDFSYGISFIILAWYLLLTASSFSALKFILVLMITLWGVRIATYLLIRIFKMGRDKRFDDIRNNVFKFAQFWILQAFSIWIIMLPAIYVLNSNIGDAFHLLNMLGSLVFLFGLSFETIADWQKFIFKINPKNKGTWIESGLWKYSRHPNYFGEITIWWGIFIFTVPFQSGLSWLTILGPIFITFLLLFVTGVPPLEKRYKEKYANNQGFKTYTKRTSLIIPFFPSKK